MSIKLYTLTFVDGQLVLVQNKEPVWCERRIPKNWQEVNVAKTKYLATLHGFKLCQDKKKHSSNRSVLWDEQFTKTTKIKIINIKTYFNTYRRSLDLKLK